MGSARDAASVHTRTDILVALYYRKLHSLRNRAAIKYDAFATVQNRRCDLTGRGQAQRLHKLIFRGVRGAGLRRTLGVRRQLVYAQVLRQQVDFGDTVVALGTAQRTAARVEPGVAEQMVASRVGIRAAVAAEYGSGVLRRRTRQAVVGGLFGRGVAVGCLPVVESDMLHEKVESSHAVVAQPARVSLAAAVKLSVRIVLRSLGRDVRASVTAPQSPRDASSSTVRRTRLRVRTLANVAAVRCTRTRPGGNNVLVGILRPAAVVRRSFPSSVPSDVDVPLRTLYLRRAVHSLVNLLMLRQEALLADPERTQSTSIGRRLASAVELPMIDDVVLGSSDIGTD